MRNVQRLKSEAANTPRDTGNYIEINKNSYPGRLSNPDLHGAESIKPCKKFSVTVETNDSSEILFPHSEMYGM
jgi:hypothetical protein